MNNKIYEEIEFRPLSLNDDLMKVAELLYSSDNYIYPYLFDNNLSVAKNVLVNMIKNDTIYNYKNIHVATCSEQIIAIIVSKSVPIKINYQTMIDSFIKANVSVGARFSKTYNEYFKLLETEPPDIYIANVAVDKMFKGLGIGGNLMRSVLKDEKTYNLEVVKANAVAIALYKKLGFEIEYEYPGFTEVPCYRMKKQKQTNTVNTEEN